MARRISLERREFLTRTSAVTAVLGSLAAPALATAAAVGEQSAGATRRKALQDLSAADFDSLLGQRFSLYAPEEKVALTLEAVSRFEHPSNARRPVTARCEPFSLLFRSVDGIALESGIYQFGHGELGKLKLFAHQVGAANKHGSTIYEVIFT